MDFNDIVTLNINSLAFGGDGVGRRDNIVIFVRNGLPGETFKVRITEKKKNFLRGEIVEIIKKSPSRIEPECPYYGACGGCQYLHLAYPEQAASKTQQIKEILKRIGGFENIDVKTVQADNPMHYRNKIKLNTQKTGGAIELGFISTNNIDLVPIDSCMIADMALNENLPEIKFILNKWDGPLPKSATLLTSDKGVVLHYFETEKFTLSGAKLSRKTISEKIFEFPTTSFFQVNTNMASKMAGAASSILKKDFFDILVDGYCGCGFFGIFAAGSAKKVVGIDSDNDLVKCAVKNAKENKTDNAVFVNGRAENVLPKLLQENSGKKTALILDPPREGCEKGVLDAVIKHKPEKVIYISCNPPTQARDLKQLKDSYRIGEVVFIDMFPQTKHCEVIIELTKI